jgi:hypothetical protein
MPEDRFIRLCVECKVRLFSVRKFCMALSSEVKQQGHEVHHSPPSRAEVKNVGAISPLAHTYS